MSVVPMNRNGCGRGGVGRCFTYLPLMIREIETKKKDDRSDDTGIRAKRREKTAEEKDW